ncbi:MAG: thioredoxin family protein [Candidatus Thorarchaeota archaeon]|jgi:thiol-disulfide isomerase/thioredoxin
MPTLDDVKEDCPSTNEAIENLGKSYRMGFLGHKKYYNLKSEAVEKLRTLLTDYEIVVLFADWCGDAKRAVPVLAMLEEELDIKIRALGGMKKPPYGSDKHWAVPPSPEEVDIFEITSSPTILIFNKSGEEIGRIKTRAKMTGSIEEEIVKIIEDNQQN